MWKQWTNALLGLWVIIVPFSGLSGSALTWTLVVTGIVVAVLALWSVQENAEECEEGGVAHRQMQHE